jgi:NAD(P)-dependent dehydrogenase (short-subunit alcohol dehydrogenase family)
MPHSSEPPAHPAVLITGSSTGIGAACALELDRLGWRVFAGVRSPDDGQRLAAKASPRLTPLRLDVTDCQLVAEAARALADAVGPAGLAGLVNNAGIVVAGPWEVLPIEELRRQLEVNVVGQVAVTQAVLPLLRAGRGRIVLIGSVNGRMAPPYMGPYAASKHALEAIADSLRVELGPWGIPVSIVQPGSVKTPVWQKSQAEADRLLQILTPEAQALYGEDIARMRRAVERLAAQAMPVARVVRAVVHALSARRPRTRYPIGPQARLAAPLLGLLPVRLRDWLMRRALGLR